MEKRFNSNTRNSFLTHFATPTPFAECSAVSPSSSLAPASTPFSSRKRTTASSPRLEGQNSEVRPAAPRMDALALHVVLFRYNIFAQFHD